MPTVVAPTDTPVPPTPTPLPTATVAILAQPDANRHANLIEVLGSADKGVEWCTNATGAHMIRYLRGAFSPFPTDDGCDPKGCWKGSVFVYKNATVDGVFANKPKGEPVDPLFIVGWNDWLQTPADAESKQLEARTIHLNTGDCLRFIAVDARDAYHWPADNRGAVQIEVLAPASGLCLGLCWQTDDKAQTLTWTGPTDGSEDIWLGSEESLAKVQSGYTAIFDTAVPMKAAICVGQIDGQLVADECTPQLVELAPGRHSIVSQGPQGGFRVGINPGSATGDTAPSARQVQVGPYRDFRSELQAETLLLNVVTEGHKCMPLISLNVDDTAYTAIPMSVGEPQSRNEYIPTFGSAGGTSCNYVIQADRPIVPRNYIRIPSATAGIDMPGWCYNRQDKAWTPC